MKRMGAEVVAIAVLAAACTGSGAGVGPSEVPPSVASTTSSVEAQAPTTGLEPEFVPPPPPVTATPAELLDLLGPYADTVLRGGMVLPGSAEHVNYMVSCIESAGFAVEVDVSAGAISAAPNQGQVDRFRDVFGACEEAAFEYGLIARFADPTPERLQLQFEAFLLTHQCLEENGFATSEPPSMDVYMDSKGAIWHPYEALSPAIIETVESICTQDVIELIPELRKQGG
jgi:hypothetical protein